MIKFIEDNNDYNHIYDSRNFLLSSDYCFFF